MQNQRHMWHIARKSDYGMGAAVVFCVKKGENSNYLGTERVRKPVFYARNKFLCYNSVDDWALTGMEFSRNNQEITVRLS